jgi:hypothetical protein
VRGKSHVWQKFNTTGELWSDVIPNSDIPMVDSEQQRTKEDIKSEKRISLKLPTRSEEGSPGKLSGNSDLVPPGTPKLRLKRVFTGNTDYLRSHPGSMIDVIFEISEEEDDPSSKASINLLSQQGTSQSFGSSHRIPLTSFGELPE